MTERTIGYILLTAGIIVMIYSATQIISVFTGKAKPIQVVDIEAPEQSSTSNDVFSQLQGDATLPMPQLFDPAALNEILNLSIYYFIMQFLLGLGFKFSSLGVSMLRPVVVHVKNKKLESVVAEEEISAKN